jgi:DNA (cytosine-5)-methyltransferase 1
VRAAAHQYDECVSRSGGHGSDLTSLELFAGAGGLALGIREAGFRHLDIIECDERACTTLSINRSLLGLPTMKSIRPTDVSSFDFKEYRDRVTLLSGGVPCQPFSLGGKHAGYADARNLFPAMFRAVREIRPKVVIIENVRGLLRENFLPYFRYIIQQLQRPDRLPRRSESWHHHLSRLQEPLSSDELSYSVERCSVNCSDFGVPQQRERVFIVAFRSDLGITWDGLAPTHSKEALIWAQWVDSTYWTEHDLIAPPQPSGLRHRIRMIRDSWHPGRERWRTVRDAIGDLPAASENEDHPTVPNHRINPGARHYKGHTGSPYDWPSKALKAGAHGVPGGENTLRLPDGSLRYYTLREAARLQTFPDAYRFPGPWNPAMRQLGNAVPVLMARLVADSVRAKLLGSSAGEPMIGGSIQRTGTARAS